METVEKLTVKYFGAKPTTVAEVVITVFFVTLISVCASYAIFSLLLDPTVAEAASWGFMD